VNNIRVTAEGQSSRPLSAEERAAVIQALRTRKDPTAATVRAALGISRKEVRRLFTLNLEADSSRKLNADWFRREIIGAVGSDRWEAFSQADKDAVNKAVLKFDPRDEADAARLGQGCRAWWGLSEHQAAAFVKAWRSRPPEGQRVKLSRRAIKNLLPYMRQGATVTEARKWFAEDAASPATPQQRARYSLGVKPPSKAARRFLTKHPDLVPPAPAMANPVVRKAIHEVRRHLTAWLRKFGRRPDRVIVELARDAKHSAVVANRIHKENQLRRERRRQVEEQFAPYLEGMTLTQRARALDRILLCEDQRQACAYTGERITEPTAARGDGVEIDHIVPRSRGGGNGLHNRVLCCAGANRGKANLTPKQWLSEEAFGAMEQRLGHWKADKQLLRKWHALHRDAPSQEDFVQSQLSDTAYASRQVARWLEAALFADRPGRQVFATTGAYTAMLRGLWGLHFDQGRPEPAAKSRADHRHHAIDAVVAAFSGPERIGELAGTFQQRELAHAAGRPVPRLQMPVPWGAHEAFRRQVIDAVQPLLVCHRPQRRRVAGALHKETLYGPIPDPEGRLTTRFRQRIPLGALSPRHLRVPQRWDELAARLAQARTKAAAGDIRRRMLALKDPPPGKPGLVRDRWFRHELREWLRAHGLDPDAFAPPQLRDLIRAGKNTLPSGVPVRRLTLVRVLNNPVLIPRKSPDPLTGRMEPDPHPRSLRVYDSQNNHHIEIRRDAKGAWTGQVITNFQAARRVRPPKASGRSPVPVVNREDTPEGTFVMSLSIGETVRMRDPKTRHLEYFVVFKIDFPRGPIHFVRHWDAGAAAEDERHPARQALRVSVAQLQALGLDDGTPPTKVRVGPLGSAVPLVGD
ncbi:MAG TPA: HNH endonuclease domain-containing protein, partial [Phycisphaerae bacterium]|nr:HNH endonuclease domain-containing protein [Phycisphaerae bacterium]